VNSKRQCILTHNTKKLPIYSDNLARSHLSFLIFVTTRKLALPKLREIVAPAIWSN